MKKVEIDGYPFKKYWIGGRPENYHLLKLFLIEKYKVCYFCFQPVRDWPHIDGGVQPDDSATIEHIVPRPYRKRGEITEKVLACCRCNQDRNDLEQKRRTKRAIYQKERDV